MIEIEQRELEKIKEGLEEAEAKIRRFWHSHDNGDDEADLVLEGLCMINEVLSEIDSWLDEYNQQVRADEQKLAEWKVWATK